MGIINIYDNSDKLYYIGGVVRDKLLGVESFDVDITYIGDAIEYCKKFGEVIKTNPDFGTIKVKLSSLSGSQLCKQVDTTHKSVDLFCVSQGERELLIDFASTRCEIYEKKGHLPKIVKLGCSLKEDVLRRDFTVNALAMSVSSGEIIDYVGGLEDLKNKKLRVLYNESFVDDPTRIIRGLKFRVRFGFELEECTKKLQEEYLGNINYDMSYKRVKNELIETFNLNSQVAFEKFVKEDIYKLVSAEKFIPTDFDIEGLIKKYPVCNPWLVYIGLLPDLSRLELTKDERKIIEDYKMIGELKTDFEIYKAFENVRLESILLYAISRDKSAALKYLDDLCQIKLQITGEDLKRMGIEPSPKYSEIFDFVLRKKLENPLMSKEDELRLIKEI